MVPPRAAHRTAPRHGRRSSRPRYWRYGGAERAEARDGPIPAPPSYRDKWPWRYRAWPRGDPPPTTRRGIELWREWNAAQSPVALQWLFGTRSKMKEVAEPHLLQADSLAAVG